ncbi:MAG TPA: hypothetical protein ENI54_01785 [bacterium]|nr:hypothetical protein [bacterium]
MADFDNIKEIGFFKALFLTWKKSLFSPEVFYKELNYDADAMVSDSELGILHPYFYALIFTYIGLVFSLFWEVFFFKISLYSTYAILPEIPLFLSDKSSMVLYLIAGIIFLLLLFGILYTIFLAILTIIIHGFVMLMGGNRGIKNTFRIIGYASGVGVFSILPIFGYNISAAWFAVLLIIGVKETGKLSTQRSIMTLLLPFILISMIFITFLIKIILTR